MDFAGNVMQWVSDERSELGIPASDDTAGLSTPGWKSFLNGGFNRFSATTNLLFGSLGSAGVMFSENKNAGQIYGGTGGGATRGGSFFNTGSAGGLFAVGLSDDIGKLGPRTHIGFRCVYMPP